MTTVSDLRIGGYHPNSFIDYPGKVAAVVFFQGCNFRCPFCHNGQLIPRGPVGMYSSQKILVRLQKRVGQLAGVVLSGGEPTLQPTLANFCSALKALGYAVKLDTNGSNPEMVQRLLADALIDYVAMDIKAPFTRYSQLAGCEVNVGHLCRSIKLISESGIAHHFRTTFDQSRLTVEDLEQIKALVPDGSTHQVQPCRPSSNIQTSNGGDANPGVDTFILPR